MTIRTLLIAGIAITSGIPASAQDITAPATNGAAAIPSEGIRIAEASNGFQLVEHGLWRSAQTAPASRPSVADDGRVNLPYRYEPNVKPAPSGFRRATYLPHIYAAEAKYSLPAGLLDALVWTESRYNPLAVSPAGAAGLGQLMPATAKELGVFNRFDPMANIFGAARYLVSIRRGPPCLGRQRALLSVLLRVCLGAIGGSGDGIFGAGAASAMER